MHANSLFYGVWKIDLMLLLTEGHRFLTPTIELALKIELSQAPFLASPLIVADYESMLNVKFINNDIFHAFVEGIKQFVIFSFHFILLHRR